MKMLSLDDAIKAVTMLLDDPDDTDLIWSTDVINNLQNAPSVAEIEPPHGWISVDDRLPPMRERVIAYAENKGGGEAITIIAEMSNTNLFDQNLKTEPYWMAPFQYFSDYYEITHWQYLPEPPKEK